jgi:hypothetical protein
MLGARPGSIGAALDSLFPLSDSRHTASTRLIRRVGNCTGLVNLKIIIHVVGFSVQERANVYANRQLFPQLNAAFCQPELR